MTPEEIKSLREKFFKECEFFTRRQIFEWFIKELQERNSDVASDWKEKFFEEFMNRDRKSYGLVAIADWIEKNVVPSSNNSNQASVASHSCTAPTQIEQFREQLLTIIYSNQEATKRAKANKMPVMEIFETTNIYDAVINEYEDLFSIITNLPLKFPEGHSEMINMLNSEQNDNPGAPQVKMHKAVTLVSK